MSPLLKTPRTRRGYLAEIVCASAIWIVNLWQLASHFHAMTFIAATTAVMIFLIVPAEIARASAGLRRTA